MANVHLQELVREENALTLVPVPAVPVPRAQLTIIFHPVLVLLEHLEIHFHTAQKQ